MADELKPAYLLAGSDRPKVDRALAAAARPVRAGRGRAAHAADDATGEDVVAACNALGLFAGDGRLIVVDGVEAWKADGREGDRRLPQGARAGDDARARRRRAEEGRAAREGGRADGRGAALGRRQEGACRRWVAEQFKLHGAKAEPGGVPRADRARRRRPLRARDGDRQARDLGGRRARSPPPIVEELVAAARRGDATSRSPTPWGARDVAGVLRAAEQLLERTPRPALAHDPARRRHPHEPRRAPPPCQALEAEGLSAKDAAGTLKQHPFYVAEALRAGAQLHRGRAARRDGPPRRARPRAEGRLAPGGRARARAGADRDHAAARASVAGG